MENSYIALLFLPMCKKKQVAPVQLPKACSKFGRSSYLHIINNTDCIIRIMVSELWKAEIKKAGKKQKQAGYLRSLLEDTVIKKY